MYVTGGEYEYALMELEQVRQLAPREASVHFLLGKIYKKLNQVNK